MIKLAFEGYITGFDIDTAYFDGNQAPLADVEACYSPHNDYDDDINVSINLFNCFFIISDS